jgi:hypothetical protein
MRSDGVRSGLAVTQPRDLRHGFPSRVEPPFQKKDKGGHRQECDAGERQNTDSKQDNE